MNALSWTAMSTAVACLALAWAVSAAAQLQPRPTHEPIVTRLDPRLDRVVPPGTSLEKIVDDHGWPEGPVFLRPSGHTGSSPFTGSGPGSNGLALDPMGRLVVCQHGDRRISRRETDGRLTALVDHFERKRISG
jgi:gluconolactonase